LRRAEAIGAPPDETTGCRGASFQLAVVAAAFQVAGAGPEQRFARSACRRLAALADGGPSRGALAGPGRRGLVLRRPTARGRKKVPPSWGN